MPAFTTTQNSHSFTVSTDELELSFSLDNGGLRMLRRRGGPNVVGYGDARPGIDVQAGVEGTWLAERVLVRYLRHSVEERNGGIEVIVVIGIGPLMLYDRYLITGTLIARRVSVQNVSDDEIQLRGVRLSIPWACVGSPETCRFEAPGNSVRPRVALVVAAAQRRGVLPRRFFAPGLRNGRALELAPIHAPGLMALHDPQLGEALLCWYYSEVEPAQPQLEGNGSAVTLVHDVELADRLRSEVALNGGTQYIMPMRASWPEALAIYRNTFALMSPHEPLVPPAWVRAAALYEVHPAEFGGYAGVTAALDQLRELGVNTLCLLPIWSFHNRKNRLWDGNWYDSGDPYVIRDYESFDATLGSLDQLHDLVNEAHTREMRVLLDLPLAGCDPASRYIDEHPDWFCYDDTGDLLAAPSGAEAYRFDWANDDLQEYLIEQACAHVRTFGFDGYRAVGLRSVAPNWARRLVHHASASSLGAVRTLRELQRRLKSIAPEAVIWSELGGPIFGAIADLVSDELPHHQFIHTALNRMRPIELGEWLKDHREANGFTHVRASFAESYTTRLLNPLADGLRGSRISRLVLAGMVLCNFVPMVRCGQEQSDAAFIARLLRARARHQVLREGAVYYNRVACDSADVFAVVRAADHQHVLGLLNIGPHKRTVTIGMPLELLNLEECCYTLWELLEDVAWVEDDQRCWGRSDLVALRLTLEPFGAYAFLLKPL